MRLWEVVIQCRDRALCTDRASTVERGRDQLLVDATARRSLLRHALDVYGFHLRSGHRSYGCGTRYLMKLLRRGGDGESIGGGLNSARSILEPKPQIGITNPADAGRIRLRHGPVRRCELQHQPSAFRALISARTIALASPPSSPPNLSTMSEYSSPSLTASRSILWKPEWLTSNPNTSRVNTPTFSPNVSISGRSASTTWPVRRTFQAQLRGTSCNTTGEWVAMIATPFRFISRSERARTNADNRGGWRCASGSSSNTSVLSSTVS